MEAMLSAPEDPFTIAIDLLFSIKLCLSYVDCSFGKKLCIIITRVHVPTTLFLKNTDFGPCPRPKVHALYDLLNSLELKLADIDSRVLFADILSLNKIIPIAHSSLYI